MPEWNPKSSAARIAELETQNAYLLQQLDLFSKQRDAETRLRLDMQEKWHKAEAAATEGVRKAAQREEYFRQAATRNGRGLSEIKTLADRLCNSLAIRDDGFL